MMKKLMLILLIVSITFYMAQAQESRILRFPNASQTQITFCHAGDIFVVSKSGGLARRITTSEGIEMFPRFSPDGGSIAFCGEYDGNREVYVMPSEGGEPQRLTYGMDVGDVPDRMGPNNIVMQWTD
jgi:tricorn protease